MSQLNPRDLLMRLMHRAQTLEIVGRTEAKAKRGAELRPWAMGVKRHLVDAESSLGRDDANFMIGYAADMVSGTAVYPIMNAIDSITSIAELIDGRTKSRDSSRFVSADAEPYGDRIGGKDDLAAVEHGSRDETCAECANLAG